MNRMNGEDADMQGMTELKSRHWRYGDIWRERLMGLLRVIGNCGLSPTVQKTKANLSWFSLIALVAFPFIVTACMYETTSPTPPVMFPFEVQKRGSKLSQEITIVEHRPYLLNLKLRYKDGDEEDRKRVSRLAGGYEKDSNDKLIAPGVPVRLRITIADIDASGERLILEQEESELRMSSYGAGYFDKRVAEIPLRPGRYRIGVESLIDVPELLGTQTVFSISFVAKANPIQ